MRTALITTTINVPHVLSLYRAYDPDVQFFIAGDEKSPHDAIMEMDLPNTFYYGPTAQRALGYKCSELIGWNCIQRRNIALLEALKWGADVIVSIDDDNIPLDASLFYYSLTVADERWDSLQVIPDRWFNVGDLTIPYFLQRGIPYSPAHPYIVSHATNQRVGVAQGVCFGDSDCSAQSRLDHQPPVRVADELLRNGVLFLPQLNRWTVFNTQSTAMIRELAPAWFCPPALGRFDDIVASLITQRIMRELNLAIHFGPPFFYQQRNFHDLNADLEQERWGSGNIERIANFLDACAIGPDVLKAARTLWRAMSIDRVVPERASDAALAFLEDVESLL